MESAVWFLKKIQINQDWILNTDKICCFHRQNICSVQENEYTWIWSEKEIMNLQNPNLESLYVNETCREVKYIKAQNN